MSALKSTCFYVLVDPSEIIKGVNASQLLNEQVFSYTPWCMYWNNRRGHKEETYTEEKMLHLRLSRKILTHTTTLRENISMYLYITIFS